MISDTCWSGVIAERLSTRLLILQCSGRIWASVYIYVNVCNAFGPGDHPGGKHVLKMASSPSYTDSVEERRRLQGRARTQRHRDRQNEDAWARRRQGDRDRRRVARERATEIRRRPQEPPEKRSVCTLRHRLNHLYQLQISNNPHNTLWFTLGSHVKGCISGSCVWEAAFIGKILSLKQTVRWMGLQKALHLQIVLADIELFLHRRDLEQHNFDCFTFTDLVIEKQIII